MDRQPLIAIAALFIFCSSFVFADEPDFNRDVRPILSDKCYFCHGPDEDNRQADLRLDTFEGSRAVIDSGHLIERVVSEDADERMPPPEAKLSLTDREKEILKSWIEHGANYELHWAYVPLPSFVKVPSSEQDNWSKQTLDRFIFDRLVKQKLTPSRSAEPLRWLRRVTFDLTGLPPTVEEMDRFLQELSQADRDIVYNKVVDRLLSSPAYGEHMAVSWLDAARYADSYGYQSDRLNTQWPYRDWVVDAFNDNLPYDQFLTWQLAGDLLETPTRTQRLATAFNRIHRLNNEGGAVFEEWRMENVADRVQTFGTTFLGLTLECCRCHDHKYDPIPMRDYYAMAAFFNSIDENGVYDNSEKIPAPSLLLPTEEQSRKLEMTRSQWNEQENEYSTMLESARLRYEQWKQSAETQTEIPGLIRSLSFDLPYQATLKDEIYYPGTADAYLTKPLDSVEVTDNPLPALDPTRSSDVSKLLGTKEDSNVSRRAVRLDGERGIVMPNIERFDRWTPFTITISMKETRRVTEISVLAQCSFGQLTFNGWDLSIANGYPLFRMYRVWPGNAIAVRATEQIPADQWFQISATYDGSSKAKGLRIYVDGQELKTEIVRDRIKKKAMAKVHHGGKLTIGQRFRDRGLADGLIDDVRVYDRALTQAEVASLATGEHIEPTFEYFVSTLDQAAMQAFVKLTQARKDFVLAEEATHEIPIMEEMSSPRETHVLARGAYDAPTNDQTRVSRRTLTHIGPDFPSAAPLDRLGLAQWATMPSHPLTSRVIVNRLWSNFFGHGLVRTPENFGLQGALPTHPELLDWLARDFINSNWNIKRLCRNIVMSSTYRQDSRATSKLNALDPENKLLARGPAYRLSSEQIRDLALATSGLLNRQRGGPPVSPYQAGGDLWRESNTMSPAYKQSVGKDLYRRSIYSVWKRTAPLPNMLAFDAESREVCIVKRSRTNTPLQALVLMNDQQFVESARTLATRVIQSDKTARERIETAFRRLTGRIPDEVESSMLDQLYQSEKTYYESTRSDAEKLIAVGESTADEDVDVVELAAMTIVCQAIMNLDATIWKR